MNFLCESYHIAGTKECRQNAEKCEEKKNTTFPKRSYITILVDQTVHLLMLP